jgi:hypothetical protein
MLIKTSNKAIFAFSDTHGNHRHLQVPENADIVICAGDAVEDDLKGVEYDDFISWFGALPAKWKLFVPGNHELSFDLHQADMTPYAQQFEKLPASLVLAGCRGGLRRRNVIGTISKDSQGLPMRTSPKILTSWLHTGRHTASWMKNLGSPEILNFVLKAQPKWHLFGHIHATEGQQLQLGSTTCQNISVFNAIS